MNGEMEDRQSSDDAQVFVERAERMVSEQAGISISEASIRISLYARFHDLKLGDACQRILHGTIRLLTVNETRRQPPQADSPS